MVTSRRYLSSDFRVRGRRSYCQTGWLFMQLKPESDEDLHCSTAKTIQASFRPRSESSQRTLRLWSSSRPGWDQQPAWHPQSVLVLTRYSESPEVQQLPVIGSLPHLPSLQPAIMFSKWIWSSPYVASLYLLRHQQTGVCSNLSYNFTQQFYLSEMLISEHSLTYLGR